MMGERNATGFGEILKEGRNATDVEEILREDRNVTDS